MTYEKRYTEYENRNSTILTLSGRGRLGGKKYSSLLREGTKWIVHELRMKNIEFEVFKETMQ